MWVEAWWWPVLLPPRRDYEYPLLNRRVRNQSKCPLRGKHPRVRERVNQPKCRKEVWSWMQLQFQHFDSDKMPDGITRAWTLAARTQEQRVREHGCWCCLYGKGNRLPWLDPGLAAMGRSVYVIISFFFANMSYQTNFRILGPFHSYKRQLWHPNLVMATLWPHHRLFCGYCGLFTMFQISIVTFLEIWRKI